MEINEAVVIAAGHFVTHIRATRWIVRMFHQYAIQELKLSEDEAKKFSENAANGLDAEPLTTTAEERQRFFIWYYINFVSVKKEK